jgi:hypothetical protein
MDREDEETRERGVGGGGTQVVGKSGGGLQNEGCVQNRVCAEKRVGTEEERTWIFESKAGDIATGWELSPTTAGPSISAIVACK